MGTAGLLHPILGVSNRYNSGLPSINVANAGWMRYSNANMGYVLQQPSCSAPARG